MKEKISLIVLLLLPFVDLITALNARYSFMPISLGIIYKALLCIFLIFYILFFSKNKYRKLNIIYWVICFIYVIGFFLTKTYIFTESNLFAELVGLFKFLFTGFIILAFLCISEDFKFKKDFYNNILFYTLLIYTVLLIIPIITNTGFPTYPLRLNSIGTIGWFYSGNEIGAIILMLFSSFFIKLENSNRKLILLLIPIIFSIFMIGTKVSWFGIIILMLFITIIYFVKNRKNKFMCYSSLIVFCLLILLTFVAPTTNNVSNNVTGNDNPIKEVKKNDNINKNLQNESCGKYYRFSSVVNNEIVEKVIHGLLNGRENKAYTLYNIYKDSTLENKFFGIGFTNNNQINNCNIILYAEIDFLDILFHYGILGVLVLLIPLVLMIKLVLKYCFKTIDNIIASFTILFLLMLSFLSGHIIGYPSCSIYLGILFMFLINNNSRYKYGEIMQEYLKKLYSKSKNEYFDELDKDLKNKNKRFIITVNPETLMMSEKDKELKNILDGNYSFVPDGIAVVKVARKINISIPERITGIDITEHLLNVANTNKYSMYLFGAKEEVIQALVEKIKKEYKNIKLLGFSNGYVDDKDKIMEDIIKLNPDICMVALGIPNQEKLIYKYFDKAKKGIYIGVGGSFDVLSGAKMRAPKIFIKLNLEWFYRIITEPKRLKRFWNSNVKFMFKIKK